MRKTAIFVLYRFAVSSHYSMVLSGFLPVHTFEADEYISIFVVVVEEYIGIDV